MPLDENQKKVIEANKEAIQQNIKRSAAFQRVLGGTSADVEIVLNEIKNFCGGDALIFDKNNPDSHLLACKVGKRDVWQFIKNCLESNIEKAKEILKDAESKPTK